MRRKENRNKHQRCMTVQVRGMKTARRVAQIMTDQTGIATQPERGMDTGAIYWVSNTYLEPLGEQMVLEALAPGSLLSVTGCSHQRVPLEVVEPQGERRPMTPGTKQRLRAIAAKL